MKNYNYLPASSCAAKIGQMSYYRKGYFGNGHLNLGVAEVAEFILRNEGLCSRVYA
jgi:hypothetical protein